MPHIQQRDSSTAASVKVMPLGAYVWRNRHLLPMDPKVFEENLTLPDQKSVRAGNSDFEVLQFEA